ncbi:seipin domain-containing protein, putative [Hepatocystis sp. ex Piliocolobus tephrosceles]|nr:seipin domain-containing protein, putative [Hepatocystis sp. ex Piliocolobus tephrosceles]
MNTDSEYENLSRHAYIDEVEEAGEEVNLLRGGSKSNRSNNCHIINNNNNSCSNKSSSSRNSNNNNNSGNNNNNNSNNNNNNGNNNNNNSNNNNNNGNNNNNNSNNNNNNGNNNNNNSNNNNNCNNNNNSNSRNIDDAKIENNLTSMKNIKVFCKLKSKYYHIKKSQYSFLKYKMNISENKSRRRNRRSYSTNLLEILLKEIKEIITYFKTKWKEIVEYYKNMFPNVNVKHCLYVLLIYLFINMALLLFCTFIYIFLYLYYVPQNMFIYPIEFSLVKNPIEDYLKYNNDNSYVNKTNFIKKNIHDYNNFNIAEKNDPLKYFNCIKNEIINDIKNKNTCYAKNFNTPSWFNDNVPNDDTMFSSFSNKKSYNMGDEQIDYYKYLQNNILIGKLNFDDFTKKNYKYNSSNSLIKFFIPFWKKKSMNKLSIKKGNMIDIFFNYSNMNNEYNDHFNFYFFELFIFKNGHSGNSSGGGSSSSSSSNSSNSSSSSSSSGKNENDENNSNLILKKGKLHNNSKSYNFINQLHKFVNTPFYFFNMFNQKNTQIRLLNNYEYVTEFKKMELYIYPPIQLYDAQIVIQVYTNFIYYYMYNYPFIFFYIFIFVLSFFFIFINILVFITTGLAYYLMS